MSLESVLGHLNTAVMLLDEFGRVSYSNGPCHSALGYRPVCFGSAFPTEDWRGLRDRLDQSVQHLPLTDCQGATFDVTVTLTDRDPVMVLVELARANELSWPGEQALRRAQRRLELAQEAGRSAFFEYLPDSDCFVTSPVGADLIGARQTRFEAGEVLSYVEADFVEALSRTFQQAIDERGAFEMEVPIARQDTGEQRWLMVKGEMRDDLDFGESSMLGTIHDITADKQTSLELGASRALLSEAESILQGFSFEWNRLTNEWTVSPNFYALTGLEPQRTTRELMEGFIFEGDREFVVDQLRAAIQDRREIRIEHRVRVFNDIRAYQLIARPLCDDSGRVSRLVGALSDITELKEAQRALYESEQKFRAFMEAFPGYVFIKDARHVYRYASASEDFRNGAIRDIGTFEGKSTRDVYAPERAAEIEARDEEILRSNRAVDIAVTTAHPDGGLRYVEGSKFPIHIGDETLIGGFFVDETARHRADKAKERMSSAMEHSGEMIVITDVDGVIEYVNPVFEQIMGYTKDEVIGGHNRMWRSGLHDQSFYDEAWERIQQGETWKGTLINRKKDGSLIHEQATISQVRDDDGTVTGYVEVKRDVTEQRELEQRLAQSQKMESIGTLAGGVAHDYNNVLQTILGNAEMLLEDLDRPDLVELAEEVKRAAEQSASLTTQLLAFARKQVIQPRAVNLNVEFGRMKNMLQRLIGSGIKLGFEPEENLWNVRVDPSQIHQLMTNIVVNSRDAIGQVGEITVRTANVPADESRYLPIGEDDATDYVRIEVIDDGCGMSRAEQERAFEPFFTTKPMNEGTGLGLATVYGVIKQNRGYVFCESEKGVGTSMSVLLPRYHGAIEESSMQEGEDGSVGGDKRILLVEDDPAILKLIQRALGRSGYEIEPASGPAEALALASAGERFDLVITDVIMPTKNGVDLVREIRTHQPDIRVLFMSGYSADILDELEDGERETAFIQKPFNKSDFVDRVAAVLRES